MAVTRQYQTYYAISLTHHSETWGGVTYNKILVKEFPDSYLKSIDTTNAASANFLYPMLYKNRYYLEGQAEGHITLYNSHVSNTATVTAYTVSLKKTKDVPSSEDTIGTYTKSISTDNSVATTSYLTLPVYMNISKSLVDASEKLILHIEYTSTGGTMNVAHANDSTDIDIKIKLPYAPRG